MSPYWFNPLSFDTTCLYNDYKSWSNWMKDTGGTVETSWMLWWKDENLTLWYGLPWSSKLVLIVQKAVMWILIGVGVTGGRLVLVVKNSGPWGVSAFVNPAVMEDLYHLLQVLGLFMILLYSNSYLSKIERHMTYASRRVLSMVINSFATVLLLVKLYRHVVVFKYLVFVYYLISAATFITLLLSTNTRVMQHFVIPAYKFHDMVVGHFLFVILFILAYICKVSYI